MAATGEIANMIAASSRDLATLAQSLKDADLAPSTETAGLLKRMFQTVQQSARAALQALVERDERAAQSVVGQRDTVLQFAAELHRQQSSRLARDDPDRLLRRRVRFEMTDRLRRIYSVVEHMVISVLPQGVLAGELGGRSARDLARLHARTTRAWTVEKPDASVILDHST